MALRRVAQVLGLPPGGVEEYERLHAAVWPAVLAQIAASNVTNYSIYRYGELLFSYLEHVGEDYDADMAAMAADPTTQQWWAICTPLQRRVPEAEGGEWWHQLPEVFHVD